MSDYAAVDDYIGSLFAQEDEALKEALRDMREAGMPAIAVSPVQGKFLYLLAKAVGARRILEIGTLGAYSTIWLARALPDDGRIITLEADPLHVQVARRNLARAMLSGAAEVREGAALETLRGLIAEGTPPFDLVFIDADKENYAAYLDLSVKLSRPGTLIMADNVIRSGAVADPGAAAEPRVAGVLNFAKALAGDIRLEATEFQWVGSKGHDGIALAVVKRT